MDYKVSNRRIYVAGALCLIISLSLIVKLFRLHFSDRIILNDDKKASEKRGAIKDAGGYFLAVSIEMNSLFANPQQIADPLDAAAKLSPILGLQKEALARALSKKNRRFVWVRRKLDNRKAEDIRNLDIKGLHFKKEFKRVYPHDTLAANLIGFVGTDNQGLEGAEYRFNSILTGMDGGFLPGAFGVTAEGRNVTLTIDRYIQHVAEQAIADAVRQHNASQGTVVIMQVKTGRILAMARYPTFNPNNYSQYTPFQWRNFAVIDSYEPGSIMKIIALAALLESVPAILGQFFQCDGHIDIAGSTINCTSAHGRVGIADIIRYSCNVGIIQAVRRLQRTRFHEVLSRFGFGSRTGIDLPGENEGFLRPVSQWSGLSKYSLSIGYEMSVNAVQLTAAFSAIANGGVYMVPSIIESVEDADGTVVRRFQPRTRGRVLSRANARILMEMMRAVVLGGTGMQAASIFFAVVGKTGTSRKAGSDGSGYTDRIISSFIGMAPFDDPEVCILVVVDDPADRASGGDAAAPVFGRIIDRVLVRLGVTGRIHRGLQLPKIAAGPAQFTGTNVPDFRGMTVADALRVLAGINGRRPVTFTLSGDGRVRSQEPAPGTGLSGVSHINLFFSGE